MSLDIETNESFKYRLEILDPESKEFKLIKSFYETSTCEDRNKFYVNVVEFRISKVIENKEEHQAGSNNLMLFHGTEKKSVTGILDVGFKNSTSGYFGGDAVYLTDCSYIALNYSFSKDSSQTKHYFIFVNEVQIKIDDIKINDVHGFKKRVPNFIPTSSGCEKNIKKTSLQIQLNEYKQDEFGRLYRNIGVDPTSVNDEYCAKAEFVIPRYLISFEANLRN